MSPLEALRCLADGRRPHDAILPPCRLTGWGADAYGEEAILHRVRTSGGDDLSDAVGLEAPAHAALFATDAVLFADVLNGRIARIWRLGGGEPVAREPAVGVAFDTDLVQSRRDVAWRAEDHPELHPSHLEAVVVLGRDLAHDWTAGEVAADWRARPFLLRAFSTDAACAALFAVHRVGAEAERTVGFSHVAARWSATQGAAPKLAQVVRDRAGERAAEAAPWRPRLR